MTNRRWGAQLLMKAVASLVLLLGAHQVHATTIDYIVSDTVVGDTTGITGTVTGIITTNGTFGPLGPSDIIAWSLTLKSGSSSNTLTDADSGFTKDGVNFTATNAGLFFNFDGSDGFISFSSFLGDGTFCMTSGVYLCGLGHRGNVDTIAPLYTASFSDATWQERSGNYQFATVPVPAALPIFATGLGTLGALGWRRKRKVKPAA